MCIGEVEGIDEEKFLDELEELLDIESRIGREVSEHVVRYLREKGRYEEKKVLLDD